MSLPDQAAPVQRPNRDQITLRPSDLQSLLPPDHRARLVWAFVEGLDLAPLYERIKAIEGHAGRPLIDPAILMAFERDPVDCAPDSSRLVRLTHFVTYVTRPVTKSMDAGYGVPVA